jgi:DNA-binding beta-propeller fold protein YncE
MEKSDIRFMTRTLIVFLIACGVFFTLSADGESQSDKAYVSSQDASKLFVFDLGTNRLEKTIDIYTPTPLGKAVPPNTNDVIAAGGRIFMTVPGPDVSAAGVNELKVVDPRSDTVVATLKTDLTPTGLFAYQGRVYVVNRYGNTIQEIDPDKLQIVRTIPFAAPGQPLLNRPLCLEIVGGKIYLPFPGGLARPGVIQVLDLATGKLLNSIDFSPFSPYGPVAMTHVGADKIYLGGASNVAVLDTRTDRIIKVIALSDRDIDVQSFAQQNGKVYVASGMSMVSVIDPKSDTLIGEIDTGFHSYATHLRVGIAASAGRIYVADAGRGLKVIDAVRDRLSLTIPTGEPIGPIAILPGTAAAK